MRIMAVLLAGGNGTRMHSNIPKQFINICGKPLVIHTLEVLEHNPLLEKIIIVCNKDYIEMMKKIIDEYKITKIEKIVKGGTTGLESTYIGIKETPECYDAILIHDANRPLIDDDIIADCVKTYDKWGNAVASIKSVELTFYSENDISSNKYLNRDYVWKTHTPQIYNRKSVLEDYNTTFLNGIPNFASTTELLSSIGKKIYFSKSKSNNIKITYQEDVEIFKAILATRSVVNDNSKRS